MKNKTKRAKKQGRACQGISFPPEVLEQAKARAASEGRSLSNYLNQLILRDLEVSNDK
jgi:hypothetical protein